MHIFIFHGNQLHVSAEVCKAVIRLDYGLCGTYAKIQLLGAFEQMRKASNSFVMSGCPSVSPSVRMEILGSHWTDFNEISYWRIV